MRSKLKNHYSKALEFQKQLFARWHFLVLVAADFAASSRSFHSVVISLCLELHVSSILLASTVFRIFRLRSDSELSDGLNRIEIN